MMRRICIACFVVLLLACNVFGGGKGGSGMNNIEAALSCFWYGYKLTVIINGVTTSIKGSISEAMRLFNQEHEMSNGVPPEMEKPFMRFLFVSQS